MEQMVSQIAIKADAANFLLTHHILYFIVVGTLVLYNSKTLKVKSLVYATRVPVKGENSKEY